MLTSHLHLVPRLGMSGIVPVFPIFPPCYGQDNTHSYTHTLQGTHECGKRYVMVFSPDLIFDPLVGFSFMKRTEVRE